MKIRNAMLCAGLALGAIVAPGLAAARTYVEVDVAPPAPRYEVIPEARVGYVWAPGYWTWSNHRHVWVNGHYVRARHGHHYVSARWYDHDGRYRYEAGHWESDHYRH